MAGFLDFLDFNKSGGLDFGDIGAGLGQLSDSLFGNNNTSSTLGKNLSTGSNSNSNLFGNLVQGLGAFGNYQVNKENSEIAKRNNALQELAFAEEQQRYDDAVAKDEEDSALMSSGLRSATTKRKSGNLDPYVDQYQKTS